jgi:hypothetical protein
MGSSLLKEVYPHGRVCSVRQQILPHVSKSIRKVKETALSLQIDAAYVPESDAQSVRSTTRNGTRRPVALCYVVSPAPATGSVSVKVVPAPTVLCTVTSPPCAAITSCTI